MTVTAFNPENLHQPAFYRQVAVATGSRLVFIAGQIARDLDGSTVGAGDLAAQTTQALLNVNAAVTGAGGSFADITRLTFYVVDLTPDKRAAFRAGAMRAAETAGLDLARPMTLLGVTALAEPDLLIEIEATAILP
jgi:enamine deaminase RidA (YjgF/YER057c/UK114 family)